MEQKKQVVISVRALVEFVLRSGDIDNRRSGAAQKDAMAAGGPGSIKKIQKRMGGNYRAEVPLKYAALDEEEDIELLVEGRADGIFEEDGIVTIDEIKGVYMDLERLTEPVAVHMAQAMCYGYFYCCDRDLDGVRIQLTYCNLETEEIRRFHEDRSKEELEAWFRSVIHEYFKWARYLCHHELQRNQSISGLEFPFPTGRVSGIWRWLCIRLYPGKSGCSSRLPQASERLFPPFFPLSRPWERGRPPRFLSDGQDHHQDGGGGGVQDLKEPGDWCSRL